jgi:hypothetical protein
MSYIIKPPQPIRLTDNPSIFLAGSIEMGKAEEWQKKVEVELKDYDITILNPRRNDWDSSWKQEINNPQFFEQVNWELDGLEKADVVAMYFASNTMSPITLLELGLHAAERKVIVYCAPDFQRRGNVEIVCKRLKLPFFTDYVQWINFVKYRLDLLS